MPGLIPGLLFIGGGTGGGGAGSISYKMITPEHSPYLATSNETLSVNTTDGEVTIILPTSGADSMIMISDMSGTAFTNKININANEGNTILGKNTLTLSDNYSWVSLGIDAESTDWKIISFNIP